MTTVEVINRDCFMEAFNNLKNMIEAGLGFPVDADVRYELIEDQILLLFSANGENYTGETFTVDKLANTPIESIAVEMIRRLNDDPLGRTREEVEIHRQNVQLQAELWAQAHPEIEEDT